jgi:crossover junction endodeoxyribonuclease RusA
MIIILKLPMPPSINHYYGQCAATKFLTTKAKTFRKDVLNLFLTSKQKNTKLSDLLKVDVLFCFGKNYANDIDNRLKPLLDALQAAKIIDNDKFIVELNAKKTFDKNNEFCLIKIEDGQLSVNLKEELGVYDFKNI